MSDLFEAREKTEKGTEWRGEITVDMDGDAVDLTVRQLNDTETWEVMQDIDLDEISDMQADLPEDKVEELADLESKEDLTDEEEDRLTELSQELTEQQDDLFSALSLSTFQGIKKAAIYGVEPDQEDVREALTRFTSDIEDQYGGTTEDEACQYLNDHYVRPMIENSTDFTSLTIGVSVLDETFGDEGN